MCHRNLSLLSLMTIIVMYFGIMFWKHQAIKMTHKYHMSEEFIINNINQ